MSRSNGNGNGHGPIPEDAEPLTVAGLANGHGKKISSQIARRLDALTLQRDAIQRQIDHYTFVLEDLFTVRADAKQGRPAATLLDQAIALDAARRGPEKKKKGKRRPQRPRGEWAAEKRAQRAATAVLLKGYHHTDPRPSGSNKHIGVLIQHGYLAPKGDGYVRTSKPFTV